MLDMLLHCCHKSSEAGVTAQGGHVTCWGARGQHQPVLLQASAAAAAFVTDDGAQHVLILGEKVAPEAALLPCPGLAQHRWQGDTVASQPLPRA